MEVGRMIKEARTGAGLSQVELARRAGTSQPTVAGYEADRLLPRLDTLARLLEVSGHELMIRAVPVVRRGAVPIAVVSNQVREILHDEGAVGAWRRLLDFVDDMRGSSPAGKWSLVQDAPPLCGDTRLDAAMAAIVEQLCTEASMDIPAWTDEAERFVEPSWFVSGLPGFEAMALRDSPVAFARHGVFVNEGALDRV